MYIRNKLLKFFASLLFFAIIACNSDESSTRRVEKIIDSMTLREKLEFIGGYKNFNIRGIEKYGIPEIHMSDGPVGVRNFGPATAFPASISLAASWDTALANSVGAAIGAEARSKNVHIMLGPGMNIYRAPYCGRNFEYLGEDPFLAGEMASSYIRGMQNQGVIATAKHYAANYQEFDRHGVSSDMDERTLREIYLPAFEACVKKGKTAALMTSYNLVNGVHASQHDFLINQILRDEWGFNGVVMSDWTSTYDGVACAKAGLDLEMPSGEHMHPDTLLAAIEKGELSEEIIDDKVRHILMMYERFGYFENADLTKDYAADQAWIRQTSLEAARKGITLLKNENQMLPLNNTTRAKIAVIGINAEPAVTGGGGSSFTDPQYPLSLLGAIRSVAGKNIEISYSQAIRIEGILPPEYFRSSQFYTYVDGKKQSGISGDFFNNVVLEGAPVHSTVFQRLDHNLSDSVYPGLAETNYSARFTGYFKVSVSGNYRIAVAGDDGYRVILNGKTIIEFWQNQPETVRSCDLNLIKDKENKIVVEYYQSGGGASIRLGYDAQLDKKNRSEVLWADAVKAARESDYVIISAGFNKSSETEGIDRTWDLPFNQNKLIAEISALNKNCIVVLNAGGNISMPWINGIPVLLQAWYPGQEGNLAVAEIIFGITNPSGKLPVSFEKSWEDNATYKSYFDDDGDKKVYFSEGIFIGYRHFDKNNIEPRFPFGYGLSFTSFNYSDLKIDKHVINSGDNVTVTFDIENTGKMDGDEIAQLYITDDVASVARPVKELKGFARVSLKAGEKKNVSISIDSHAFEFFHPDEKRWLSEPGKFTILIGSSSRDIRLQETIEIQAKK